MRWGLCTDIAAHTVAKDSNIDRGKRAMESVHRRVPILLGDYVLGFSADRLE